MDWSLYPVSEFADWSDQWALLNRQAGNSQLLSVPFVQPLINCFAPADAKLAVCQSNKTIIAMTIITPEKSTGWSSFQPSQAPIGLWIQQPEFPCEQLIETLLSRLPGLKWVFSLTQQDPELLPRPTDCQSLTSMDYIETASLKTEGNFDEYFSQRSKNHRQNLRRQRNRLEREEITTRLETIDDPLQVVSCIEDYGQLESSGWKNQLDTAIHSDNAQGKFYTSMLESFMSEAKAKIYRYWYNDDLVAMDLAIHDGNTMVILKTTYDESIKTSSPGVLMHQEIFQQLFESDNINKVEFYGKLMDWHKKWTTDIRTMYHLTHYTWAATLAKKLMRITDPVRQILS